VPAGGGFGGLRGVAARVSEVIRIEAIWLAMGPVDMPAGRDTLLAQVVSVFGAAQPHHAYGFANRRASRMRVLVHDGIGIWLAARRLHQGGFMWPGAGSKTAATSPSAILLCSNVNRNSPAEAAQASLPTGANWSLCSSSHFKGALESCWLGWKSARL
jgi:transposase